ncbi:acyl-CoA carboxylase subunit beta [Desulfoluna spongiiphila]|uniref:3-methylcrotonyl-CoA carboxylase beta subunit/propionyl-CoA carboxylase n=1 Tax=Desulfoluna spongiiphila TaxID=419481 RepID=A0A1G5GSN4_9BACT|nr:carboxyl transferase domain-containing protein [Desulfoluna spongiiphila]SCY54200.1 3-methylcrotonyl-CoA carboxylase beta subunit/propionyl-CoA carboxylase [Desulfoluna spongiiphila]
MAVIRSAVDTKSDTYRKNFEAMAERVGVLKQRLGEAREARSEKARSRLAQQGKLSVRERLDLLLDRNTPFLELGALAAYGQYDGKVHGAGSVMGIGVIHGREVMVHANDPTIKGGTVYPMGVKKTLRCQAVAMENRLPTVYLIDSGGAFLPLQSEVFPDIDDGGRVFYNQAMMSKMGIPQVTSVMGLCTAGAAYIPAMSDEVVHVKGTGAIFLGGPPLVKAATGEEVTAEELGGADLHCRESGVSDYQAENDAQALSMVRESIRQLPRTEKCPLPMEAPKEPLYDPEEIYGIASQELKTPYEVREIIARLVDGSDFHEFKPLYGPTLVCGFARIHGYPVGILGNNGILFSESALKATQFIQLCDRRGIPLVFLQNINGYIIGKAYEAQGITKDGHKMVNAVATASVPKFTVMVGASFGAGNYGMCGRAYSPRLLWTWPSHEIGVMGGEQASDVLVTVKNEQLAREGQPPLTDEMVDQIRVPVMDAARKEGDAYYSTSHLWDDGIIDPKDTRTVLALSISAALNAPLRDDKEGFGVFRM